MYFKILIVGAAVLFLFRILSFLKKTLPFSKKVKHYTGFLLPVVELLSWFGFGIWCLHHIYDEEAFSILIIIGVLTILLMAPAWFLVRDFLHGMILKIQRKIELDTTIEIGDIKGVIVKAEYFTFDIKTKNGNIDTIPYNKIRSKIITKNAGNIHLEKQFLSFQIPLYNDINKIIPELKQTLINAPWVAASQEPIINIINRDASNMSVEAIVHVIKKEHADKIVQYVKQNFTAELS